MSLIEEALRKAEPPKVHSWSLPTQTPPASVQRPRSSPALMFVTFAIGVCSVLLLAGGGLWIGRNLQPSPHRATTAVPVIYREDLEAARKAPPPAAPASAPVASAVEQAPAPPPPPPAPQAPPAKPRIVAPERLVLTGVAEGRGEAYAMMNGSIVVVGDRIGEYTVMEIDEGSVRLQKSDGSETILRVPR